jgi:peptidoglycan/LPS O-acetylase OafA/YrhL
MTKRYNESTWAVLAGLRFLLAGIVLIAHLQVFVVDTTSFHYVTDFGARAAVLGFLLISGVSIGHSYKQGSSGYFRRRFLRIYPLYFFAVLFTCLITILVGSPYQLPGETLVTAGWKTAMANFLFMQGFIAVSVTYNGPLWTVAVEVFYYLLAPILSRCPVYIFLILIAASMATYLTKPEAWILGYPALRYCWPWLIGFLVATQQRRYLVCGLLVAGVAVTALGPDTYEPLSSLTFAIIAITIVAATIYPFSIPLWLRRILNYFGEISYPIYLLHFPLYIALYRYAGLQNAWQFVLCAFILTAMINYIVDHRLKQVFWKPLVLYVQQIASSLSRPGNIQARWAVVSKTIWTPRQRHDH